MGLKISIYVISDVQLQSSRTLYSSITQIIWVRAILQLLDTAKFPRADWDRAHGRPRADLLEHECMINRLWPCSFLWLDYLETLHAAGLFEQLGPNEPLQSRGR